MKNILVLVGVLMVSSVAGAQPALTEVADPAPTTSSYVALGTALGADGRLDWLYSGLAVEGGYRLSPTWWLHGDLAVVGRTGYGTLDRMTVIAPSADSYEVRIGPEARRCGSSNVLCAVAGADVGYRSGKLAGLVVAPRLGLDVGGKNLRFRPGIELAVGGPVDSTEGPPLPDVGIGMTAAVAYQW